MLLGFVLLVLTQKTRWDGMTHLTIEFIVTDEVSGNPVEGAEIFVYDELHSSTTREPVKPRLTTDRDGTAREHIPNQMCYGSSSRLGFRDTRTVRIPSWLIWVNAPGFTQSEPFWLTEIKSTQHVGPGQDKLIVPIALHKSRP
jgi:hypothetical protein